MNKAPTMEQVVEWGRRRGIPEELIPERYRKTKMIKAEILMTITSPSIPGIEPKNIAAQLEKEMELFQESLQGRYPGITIDYDYKLRGTLRD